MSSQIRNANPVKVNPSMIAKANDFNANPVKVNPSMIAKANDFTVPAKSPERQKSSLDRTCASILKMTKAEYEVFKEKYTDENGSFDSSALKGLPGISIKLWAANFIVYLLMKLF